MSRNYAIGAPKNPAVAEQRRSPVERAAASSRPDVHPKQAAKDHGVHYTPAELAGFLARRILQHLDGPQQAFAALDPACGEGELLVAIAHAAMTPSMVDLVGVDRDEFALARARGTLSRVGCRSFELVQGDFLATARPAQLSLVPDDQPQSDVANDRLFDVIISNPPYVRTQVLGADAAKDLSVRFALSGRVDLYQAFVRAMTPRLRPGGVLGLLCSNRFLTIQAGQALRDLLSVEYELCEIFDLGDTKLFEAAVLPAIVIARRRPSRSAQCSFTRAYECDVTNPNVATSSSVISALEDGLEGVVAVANRRFEIERGELNRSTSPKEPWGLTHVARERWLETIDRHTMATFDEIGEIRVGIKTTADRVFIRSTWDDLPDEFRPEPELIHPLLTHHVADRWRARDTEAAMRTVLYPHTTCAGKRCAIALADFPRAAAYLETHRETLEARSYVAKANREWFEIWVPQQPTQWQGPKVVFPDISDVARFFLDTSGAIVNGDCYWIALSEEVTPELASLVIAVANSSFALAFYDAVCGNRLYAGRRRFITQYVRRFPLPSLRPDATGEIHERVQRLRNLSDADATARARLESELDALVWEGFGLSEEVRR